MGSLPTTMSDNPMKSEPARQADKAALLYSVAALAAEESSLEDALQACVDTICRLTGWPVGRASMVTADPIGIAPAGIWHVDDGEPFRSFVADAMGPGFGAGTEFPSHVQSTGEPCWVSDVTASPYFPQLRDRLQGPIRSAFGFPIRSNGSTVAVLEFFCSGSGRADPELLLAVQAIGDQVGRALERRLTEDLLRERNLELAVVNRINLSLAGELHLESLVQAVTDAATEVTGAAFGAFFYNVVDPAGESYTLYTISGVPREEFSKFPMPRNTEVFAPTFAGEAIVRSADITKDPRYGKAAPYYGMPDGHLPVRSYLAVPVRSRSGEVVGGVFLGHPEADRFGSRHEAIVAAIAVQAGIGIDNARLFGQAENEIAERKKVEAHQDLLLAELSHRVKNMLAVVMGIAAQTARSSTSLEGFTDGFLGRLAALGRAHSLITARNWTETPLSGLVQEVFAPYADAGDGKLQIHGPELALKPKAAVTVSMILHELVTNAAKYGALSCPDGRISVGWNLEEGGGAREVSLQWRETGVAGLRPPSRRGFGTRMIETSARHELGGKAEVTYYDDGVGYQIEFSLNP